MQFKELQIIDLPYDKAQCLEQYRRGLLNEFREISAFHLDT